MKILNLLEIHSDLYSVFTGLTLFDTSKIYVAEFFLIFLIFLYLWTKIRKNDKNIGRQVLDILDSFTFSN